VKTADETERSPALERREEQAGRKPGDRYIRIVRPASREFRRAQGHYIATD